MTNDEIKKIEEQIAKNKEKIKELKKKRKLVLNKEQELKEKKILAMIKKIYNIESEQNLNYIFGILLNGKEKINYLKNNNNEKNLTPEEKIKLQKIRQNFLALEKQGKMFLNANRWWKVKSRCASTFDFSFF